MFSVVAHGERAPILDNQIPQIQEGRQLQYHAIANPPTRLMRLDTDEPQDTCSIVRPQELMQGRTVGGDAVGSSAHFSLDVEDDYHSLLQDSNWF